MSLDSKADRHLRFKHLSRYWLLRLFFVAFSAGLSLFVLEYGARYLTEKEMLQYYKPLQSQIDPKTEDWRWTHTFNDENFEPDPVLFWTPRLNHFPFDKDGTALSEQFVCYQTGNNQPKILIYGDSNTQGLATNSWANELQLLLLKSKNSTHVLNRGVVGYSSFQGVERLKQDLKKYKPKVIVFAFGWNDVAPSVNAADPFFKPYPVVGGSILARSRAYAVGVYYSSLLSQRTQRAQKASLPQSRMTVDMYLKKLKEMYVIAKQHGAEPIIISRPYNDADGTFAGSGNWREQVPYYNAQLRALMQNDAAHFVDFESYFKDKAVMFIDESHFDPRGHRLAGMLLFEHLLQYEQL
ncbi:SGNH/GDSL hydrolase family protein [Patescibacteria group bacterium]|nr:SGNH/GDSL hydrolase family protein [Patescibacteria group bacterium]